jgi:hypothetical protein
MPWSPLFVESGLQVTYLAVQNQRLSSRIYDLQKVHWIIAISIFLPQCEGIVTILRPREQTAPHQVLPRLLYLIQVHPGQIIAPR